MRKLLLFIAVATLGLTSSCSSDDAKNPCEGIVCLNDGYCANGSCVCPEGFTGSNCSQQVTPSVIRIHKIEVTKFPPTRPNGGGWDTNGTAPDIYPEIRLGEALIWSSSSSYAQNAIHTQTYTFTPNPIISLTNVGSQYSIILYDYDDFSSDEFMGGINFVPYQSNNNFPEIITLDAGGTVAFKLYVSYAW